jgi:anti-sigma regulatory factor (Ser/Thr protein kinase)/DNA-binding XRE family transcriptional regulator
MTSPAQPIPDPPGELDDPSVLAALMIAGRPDQLRAVRALVAGALGADSDVTETAVLLTSELVANSVRHSDSRRRGGRVTIRLVSVAGGVRVEVADDGAPTRPALAAGPRGLADGGRGLQLVEALADRWGFEPGQCRLTTWFELDGAAAPAGPGADPEPVPAAPPTPVSRFAHRGHQPDGPLVPSRLPDGPLAPACCVLPHWIVILDSELVRAARRAAGLSQERLAYKSGLSRDTVGKLERQRYARCHLRTRYLVATAMGAHPLAITATFG